MPSAAALAGSRSDAESVKIATRLKRVPPRGRAGDVAGMIRAGSSPVRPEPLRFGAMDRSLWAVLVGTFTLRFSTGPHRGDARRSTSPTCPSTAARRSTPTRRRPVRRDVLPRRAGPLADLRDPVRPARPPPGHAVTARSSAAIAVILTGLTTNLPILGGDAHARRRVDRRQRPVDPRLHRDRRPPATSCCAARRRPASRARRCRASASGFVVGADAFEALGPDGVLPQRRRSTASRS